LISEEKWSRDITNEDYASLYQGEERGCGRTTPETEIPSLKIEEAIVEGIIVT